MNAKYFPRNKIKKLEMKIWESKVKIKKYVGGLPDMIHGSVMASKPKTMLDAIEFATEMMDKKICTYVACQTENKKKFEDTLRNNQNQQQQNKWQQIDRAYTAEPSEKRKSSGNANTGNNHRTTRANQRGNSCYECGAHGHFKRECPKLKNKNRGNQRGNGHAPTKVYAKYMLKGWHVLLAHVTTMKTEDMSEGKQLKDVEFHIDLILGVEPVARAPYRLAPSERKELLDQLRELSDKGFEHEEHLKTILELLKKEELYAKFSKCEFWIPKHKLMEFQVGDKVMIKVLPWKWVVCFGKRGKLNPRFVGPFKVLEKVVSKPMEIMDRDVKRLKQSRIPIVKVRWNSRRGPEFTWEREDQFQKNTVALQLAVKFELILVDKKALEVLMGGLDLLIYKQDYCCFDGSLRDEIICDLNKTPDLSQRPPQNCPNEENGILQCLLDASNPSNDNTNVVLQEPFVIKQDPGKNSAQSTPQIYHYCCYICGDPLEDIFCHQCTCELCGNGAHYGYNCPPKVPIVPNPEPFNNQTIDEFPQTLSSFDPTCYSEDGKSFTYDPKSNLVHNSPNVFDPPPQPPLYSCEFFEIDARYGHYCTPQEEEKQIKEEQAAKTRYWKIPVCYDDDDDNYTIAITLKEPDNSLSMGDEHLDTVLATESDEFINSSVENLVLNSSESEGEYECDVPACEVFTTFSNILFDADYDFYSSDDQLFYDEDIPKEIYSNPLFDEEIISMKIDSHHFNVESDLIESLLNQ
nr:hypothetical protein [Tanacetum cinerariifolium]